MEVISSRDNAQIKRLCALLTQKKEREQAGLFACEGARLCADALRSGLRPLEVYVTEKAWDRYTDICIELSESTESMRTITESLALRIADTKTPQGVFAVFKMLDNRLPSVTIEKEGSYLLVAGLQDPGNLGTMLRTAEAFGITACFLDAACPDLYSSKVLRASMGGVFRLPVAVVPDMPGLLAELREQGIRSYAAALHTDSVPLTDGLLTGGSAVLIGNEGSGLPEDLISCCDASLLIPMAGKAESLGAAAAATVLLWEMTKNR